MSFYLNLNFNFLNYIDQCSGETETLSKGEVLVQQLLKDLHSILFSWSLILASITHAMLQSLREQHHLKAVTLSGLTFSAVMRTLVRLHLAYVDVVGYGCFFDVNIGFGFSLK